MPNDTTDGEVIQVPGFRRSLQLQIAYNAWTAATKQVGLEILDQSTNVLRIRRLLAEMFAREEYYKRLEREPRTDANATFAADRQKYLELEQAIDALNQAEAEFDRVVGEQNRQLAGRWFDEWKVRREKCDELARAYLHLLPEFRGDQATPLPADCRQLS